MSVRLLYEALVFSSVALGLEAAGFDPHQAEGDLPDKERVNSSVVIVFLCLRALLASTFIISQSNNTKGLNGRSEAGWLCRCFMAIAPIWFVDKFGGSGRWSRPLWLLGVVCGGLRSLEGRRDDGDVEVFV
jgi:hypothetical protein